MSIYLTAETKSENESYAMIRISNLSQMPVTIKNIQAPQCDEEYNLYLQNLVGLTIMPNSSHRFYANSLDTLEPPKENFTIRVTYQSGKTSISSVFTESFDISFKFRNMFRSYEKSPKVVLSDPNKNAEKRKWDYYSLRWELDMFTAETIQKLVSTIYNSYMECIKEKKQYSPLSDEEVASIIKDFMRDLEFIIKKEDKGLEKEINE